MYCDRENSKTVNLKTVKVYNNIINLSENKGDKDNNDFDDIVIDGEQ